MGKLYNMPRDEYLSRQKKSVKEQRNVLEYEEFEEELSDYAADILKQLYRWLANYPDVELEPTADRANVVVNECEFQLFLSK